MLSAESSLWSSNGTARLIVVGTEEGSQEFYIHGDLLLEASPVLKAAFKSAFKEAALLRVLLPQFVPKNFELFLRFVQSVALADPPRIGFPEVNDELVMNIVQIAAYLGADQVLTMLQNHVQRKATLSTMAVFEENEIQVDWGIAAFEALYKETKKVARDSARSSPYGQRKKRARAEMKLHLEGLSSHTRDDFLSFVIQKCARDRGY